MATRSARESATKQNDLHRLILTRVLNDADNKICADCTERMPRWASWSLGIFVCLKCSGCHRSLGVHISKVKSVNLDTWTRDQVNHIASRGNKWANSYYLDRHAKGQNFHIQEGDSNLHQFIRNKYEHKKYMKQGRAPELVDRSAIMNQCEREIYGKPAGASGKTGYSQSKVRARPQVKLGTLPMEMNTQNATATSEVARPKPVNQPNLLDFGDFSAFDTAATSNSPVKAHGGQQASDQQLHTPHTSSQVISNTASNNVMDFFSSTTAPSAATANNSNNNNNENGNSNSFTADFSQMSVQPQNSQTSNDPFGMFSSGPAVGSQSALTNGQPQLVTRTPEVASMSASQQQQTPVQQPQQQQSSTPSVTVQGGSAIADIMALYKSTPSNSTTVQQPAPQSSTSNIINNINNSVAPVAQPQANTIDMSSIFGGASAVAATSMQPSGNPFSAGQQPQTSVTQNGILTGNKNQGQSDQKCNSDPFAAFTSFANGNTSSGAEGSSNPFGDFGGGQARKASASDFNWT